MGYEWLNTTAALIAAFGALLGGMGALLPHLRQTKKTQNVAPPRSLLVVGILLFIFSGVVFAVRLLGGKNQPMNVRLTTTAWDAFNKGDYNAAISIANDCIKHFQSDADKQEAGLESGGFALPPTGAVSSEERQRIINRGLLNDAAACFFIKGESSSALGRKEDAINAYREVMRFKYARVFDPAGDFFWSPAEAAEGRLRQFQK